MPDIRLPDGAVKHFDAPVTVAQVAASIGPGLAKAALGGKVDGMSAYGTDEPFNLRQRNVPFLQFTPRAGGIDFYGDNLFTTEREIRDCDEALRKHQIGRASCRERVSSPV